MPELVAAPVIVIKRKRFGPHKEAQFSEPAQSGDTPLSARPSRVFLLARLASTSLDVGRELESEVSPNDDLSVRAKPLRRRRRLHSAVVITRPNVVEVAAPSQVGALQRKGDPVVATGRGWARDKAASGQTDSFFGVRTLQLIDEITELQRQIDALKRQEAAKAIRWIKAAIAAHDLTARDLGL